MSNQFVPIFHPAFILDNLSVYHGSHEYSRETSVGGAYNPHSTTNPDYRRMEPYGLCNGTSRDERSWNNHHSNHHDVPNGSLKSYKRRKFHLNDIHGSKFDTEYRSNCNDRYTFNNQSCSSDRSQRCRNGENERFIGRHNSQKNSLPSKFYPKKYHTPNKDTSNIKEISITCMNNKSKHIKDISSTVKNQNDTDTYSEEERIVSTTKSNEISHDLVIVDQTSNDSKSEAKKDDDDLLHLSDISDTTIKPSLMNKEENGKLNPETSKKDIPPLSKHTLKSVIETHQSGVTMSSTNKQTGEADNREPLFEGDIENNSYMNGDIHETAIDIELKLQMMNSISADDIDQRKSYLKHCPFLDDHQIVDMDLGSPLPHKHVQEFPHFSTTELISQLDDAIYETEMVEKTNTQNKRLLEPKQNEISMSKRKSSLDDIKKKLPQDQMNGPKRRASLTDNCVNYRKRRISTEGYTHLEVQKVQKSVTRRLSSSEEHKRKYPEVNDFEEIDENTKRKNLTKKRRPSSFEQSNEKMKSKNLTNIVGEPTSFEHPAEENSKDKNTVKTGQGSKLPQETPMSIYFPNLAPNYKIPRKNLFPKDNMPSPLKNKVFGKETPISEKQKHKNEKNNNEGKITSVVREEKEKLMTRCKDTIRVRNCTGNGKSVTKIGKTVVGHDKNKDMRHKSGSKQTTTTDNTEKSNCKDLSSRILLKGTEKHKNSDSKISSNFSRSKMNFDARKREKKPTTTFTQESPKSLTRMKNKHRTRNRSSEKTLTTANQLNHSKPTGAIIDQARSITENSQKCSNASSFSLDKLSSENVGKQNNSLKQSSSIDTRIDTKYASSNKKCKTTSQSTCNSEIIVVEITSSDDSQTFSKGVSNRVPSRVCQDTKSNSSTSVICVPHGNETTSNSLQKDELTVLENTENTNNVEIIGKSIDISSVSNEMISNENDQDNESKNVSFTLNGMNSLESDALDENMNGDDESTDESGNQNDAIQSSSECNYSSSRSKMNSDAGRGEKKPTTLIKGSPKSLTGMKNEYRTTNGSSEKTLPTANQLNHFKRTGAIIDLACSVEENSQDCSFSLDKLSSGNDGKQQSSSIDTKYASSNEKYQTTLQSNCNSDTIVIEFTSAQDLRIFSRGVSNEVPSEECQNTKSNGTASVICVPHGNETTLNSLQKDELTVSLITENSNNIEVIEKLIDISSVSDETSNENDQDNESKNLSPTLNEINPLESDVFDENMNEDDESTDEFVNQNDALQSSTECNKECQAANSDKALPQSKIKKEPPEPLIIQVQTAIKSECQNLEKAYPLILEKFSYIRTHYSIVENECEDKAVIMEIPELQTEYEIIKTYCERRTDNDRQEVIEIEAVIPIIDLTNDSAELENVVEDNLYQIFEECTNESKEKITLYRSDETKNTEEVQATSASLIPSAVLSENVKKETKSNNQTTVNKNEIMDNIEICSEISSRSENNVGDSNNAGIDERITNLREDVSCKKETSRNLDGDPNDPFESTVDSHHSNESEVNIVAKDFSMNSLRKEEMHNCLILPVDKAARNTNISVELSLPTVDECSSITSHSMPLFETSRKNMPIEEQNETSEILRYNRGERTNGVEFRSETQEQRERMNVTETSTSLTINPSNYSVPSTPSTIQTTNHLVSSAGGNALGLYTLSNYVASASSQLAQFTATLPSHTASKSLIPTAAISNRNMEVPPEKISNNVQELSTGRDIQDFLSRDDTRGSRTSNSNEILKAALNRIPEQVSWPSNSVPSASLQPCWQQYIGDFVLLAIYTNQVNKSHVKWLRTKSMSPVAFNLEMKILQNHRDFKWNIYGQHMAEILKTVDKHSGIKFHASEAISEIYKYLQTHGVVSMVQFFMHLEVIMSKAEKFYLKHAFFRNLYLLVKTNVIAIEAKSRDKIAQGSTTLTPPQLYQLIKQIEFYNILRRNLANNLDVNNCRDPLRRNRISNINPLVDEQQTKLSNNNSNTSHTLNRNYFENVQLLTNSHNQAYPKRINHQSLHMMSQSRILSHQHMSVTRPNSQVQMPPQRLQSEVPTGNYVQSSRGEQQKEVPHFYRHELVAPSEVMMSPMRTSASDIPKQSQNNPLQNIAAMFRVPSNRQSQQLNTQSDVDSASSSPVPNVSMYPTNPSPRDVTFNPSFHERSSAIPRGERQTMPSMIQIEKHIYAPRIFTPNRTNDQIISSPVESSINHSSPAPSSSAGLSPDELSDRASVRQSPINQLSDVQPVSEKPTDGSSVTESPMRRQSQEGSAVVESNVINSSGNESSSAHERNEPITEADDDSIIDLTWLEDMDTEELKHELDFIKKEEIEEDDVIINRDQFPTAYSPSDSGFETSSPQVEYNELVYHGRLCICEKPAEYICGCRMVMYCSNLCQKRDWIRHRPICLKTLTTKS